MTRPSPEQRRRAASAVREALAGNMGRDAEALAELFTVGATRARAQAERLERVEREANALAAIVADLLNAAVDSPELRTAVDKVVDDLPHDARRRVLAYRHRLGSMPWANPIDQFGPLPSVPPRAKVMRDRVRTIDGETHAVIDMEPL